MLDSSIRIIITRAWHHLIQIVSIKWFEARSFRKRKFCWGLILVWSQIISERIADFILIKARQTFKTRGQRHTPCRRFFNMSFFLVILNVWADARSVSSYHINNMLFRYDLFIRYLLICSDTVHWRILNIRNILLLLTVQCAETVYIAPCKWLKVIASIHYAAIVNIVIDSFVVILIKELLISSDTSRYSVPQEFSSAFLFSLRCHHQIASISWMILWRIILYRLKLLIHVLLCYLFFYQLVLRYIKYVKLRLGPQGTIWRVRITSDEIAFDFTFLIWFKLNLLGC